MGELYIDIELAEDVFEQDLLGEDKSNVALLSNYMKIEEAVRRINESTKCQLLASITPGKEALIIVLTEAGKLLKNVLDSGLHNSFCYINHFGNNPFYKAYCDAALWYEEAKCSEVADVLSEVNRLNGAANRIRKSIDSNEMANIRYRRNKAREKRFRSASLYIDSIRNRYSRINCLRIDFGYRRQMFIGSEDQLENLASVKVHWEKMRLDLSKGVPVSGMVGFVARLEYGVLSRFHFHALIIFDGSKRQQDISLAQAIGDHWVNVIVPNGEGRYYNCNRYKNSYHDLGIGIINHYDDSKYTVLKDIVLGYMLKTDCLMDVISPGERSMFRGKQHQVNSSARGRPRSKINLINKYL